MVVYQVYTITITIHITCLTQNCPVQWYTIYIYNYVYIYMYSTWLTIINPVSSTKKNEHYYPLNTNLPYIY